MDDVIGAKHSAGVGSGPNLGRWKIRRLLYVASEHRGLIGNRASRSGFVRLCVPTTL